LDEVFVIKNHIFVLIVKMIFLKNKILLLKFNSMVNTLLFNSLFLILSILPKSEKHNIDQKSNNSIRKPLYSENIILGDNESFAPELFVKKHCVDFSNITIGSPNVLIRSVEVDVKYFDFLRICIEFAMNLSINNYDDYYFFNHVNPKWPYMNKNLNNSSSDSNWCYYNSIPFSDKMFKKIINTDETEIYQLNYLNKEFKLLIIRILKNDAIFSYFLNNIIEIYSNVSSKYPDDWKTSLVLELEKIEKFVITLNQNDETYKRLSKEKFLPYEIGYVEAFIYRRVENDSISSTNILKLLQELKNTIKKSIGNGPFSHYKDYRINGGNLILTVEINSVIKYNTPKIIISTINNEKQIEILSPFSFEVLCLKENGKDYFLLHQRTFYGFGDDELPQLLIDQSLNIITNSFNIKSQ